MGGMAPGGGGGTPPPSRGGSPDDGGGDEPDEEENEEDDTDEETVSVTSSSQVSANRVRPLVWGSSKENEKGSEGGPQRTQMILLEEKMLKMVVGDHKDIEVRGVGLDHLEEMEQWDQWDPLDQGIPGKGWIIHHWGSTHFHGTGNTPYFQCELEYHWHGKFSALFRRITESCDAISTKCESKHGRTPKYDREKSVAPRSSFRAVSGKYMTKRI